MLFLAAEHGRKVCIETCGILRIRIGNIPIVEAVAYNIMYI